MSHSFKESGEWEALVSICKQGLHEPDFQPILWVGAGLSVPAGYPTTQKLIQELTNKSVKSLPNFEPEDTTYSLDSVNRSFTKWVQNFAEVNGYGRLKKALSNIFIGLDNQPTNSHLELVKAPWSSIYTTNYDQLLESALDENGHRFNVITHEQNLGLEKSDLLSLYKVHGGVSNIGAWTLDEKSYLSFSDQYPFLNAKLNTILLKHPVVYVGCSMLDPRVIEWYQQCESNNFSDSLEYSIVIIREVEWKQLPESIEKLYRKSNVHPLFFECFEDLPDIFCQLNEEIFSEESVELAFVPPPEISEEQRKEREERSIEDFLYETFSPCVIEIIACIWLEVSKNTSSTEHLKNNFGAKARNQGDIAFKSLLDDFVELSKKLIDVNLSFSLKIKIFSHLSFILQKYFPTHISLEEINYDPHTLFGSLHIRKVDDGEFKIDDNEISIVNNLLKDFCELIIDCSQALPSWTAENITTQLCNHTVLFENLREELERWKEKSSNEFDDVILIENEFRRAIARRFDELKIFGLNFGKRTKKYQLSIAYISLTTEMEFNDSDDVKEMTTCEALAEYKRLVILGEAGQGKTTLLQWLTVQCGRRTFEGEQEEFNEKVPVLIKLRSLLSQECLPDELDFYHFMAEGIEVDSAHKDWIASILESRQAIIMIDGFDEVPRERREEVLIWIDKLCKKYDGNHFILTSRPSAYENTSLDHLNFNVIQLQVMNRKAQSDFVEHWHHAIALEYDKTKPDALKQEAENLLEKLRQQKVLRNLAENPLLCGVLCMLHHDRNGYLPKDRTDLYESTCRLFLDSRDREKKVIETEKFHLLDLRNKESFLSNIAFGMTMEGKTSISPRDLKERLISKSKDMPELAGKVTSEELLLFFLERSGLLVQVGANEIQFTHRTFQEFYTAKLIISENDTACLLMNAGNDYWNGTIQLAIGLRTSKSENEKFLTELLIKAEELESNQDLTSATSLYLLVLTCKESMREITPKFSTKLESVIKKVVPPPTAKIRDALALAGSIAIPYLARPKRNRSIRKDHYCALALIKMATPDAYVMLKEYFKDNRWSYLKKLRVDIKKMDREVAMESNLAEAIFLDGIEKYDLEIRVMLAFLVQDERLIEKGIEQSDLLSFEFHWKLSHGLAPLNCLNEEEITELNLSGCDCSNFSSFSKFKNIESFDLQNVSNLCLNNFTDLPKLKKLDLFGAEIINFPSVLNIPTLEYLDLSYTEVESLKPIAGLVNLKVLSINGCEINALEPLSKLTKLETLYAESLSLDSLNALSSLTSLSKLELSYCNMSCRDTSSISSLVNLKHLILNHCGLSDTSFLESLVSLETLELSFNNILDFTYIYKIRTLRSLNLSFTGISDLSGAENLTDLELLDLSFTNVDSIEGLQSLTNLQELRLFGTNISSFEPLKELPNLRLITVNHEQQNLLEECNLISDPILLTN